MYKQTEQKFKLASWVEATGCPAELAQQLRSTNLDLPEWYYTCKTGSWLSWLVCEAYRQDMDVPNKAHKALALLATYTHGVVTRSRPKGYAAPMAMAARCLELYAAWVERPAQDTLAEHVLAPMQAEAENLNDWLHSVYHSFATVEREPLTTTEITCTLFMDAVCRICEAIPRPHAYGEVPGYSIAGTMQFCFTELLKALVTSTKYHPLTAEEVVALIIKREVPWFLVEDYLELATLQAPAPVLLPVGWARVSALDTVEGVFTHALQERALGIFGGAVTLEDLQRAARKPRAAK